MWGVLFMDTQSRYLLFSPRLEASSYLLEKCGILYGGLVELIVNAMADVKPGFIEWQWH